MSDHQKPHPSDGAALRDRGRTTWLLRVVAGSQLLLMLSTWPLWWGTQEFPVVPLVPLTASRAVVDVASRGCLMLFSGLLLSLLVAPGSRSRRSDRIRCGTTLAMAAALAVLNQHRLQPWHWLTMLVLAQAVLFDDRPLIRSVRLTIATVYGVSALSRITLDPTSTAAADIVRTLVSFVPRGPAAPFGESSVAVACHALTGFELLTAVLLILRWTRPAGIALALTMHGLLVLALSPAGMHHHAGVLIWNLTLAAVVLVLFRGRDEPKPARDGAGWLTRAVAGAVLLFPLSGLVGFADNWLSWQVYSPRPESLRLTIDAARVAALPEAARQHLDSPVLMTDRLPVRLDRWSLESVIAPLYPEDRFQLAIIRQLVADIPDGDFRIEITRPEVPAWWNRVATRIETHAELDRQLSEFVLRPRAILDPLPPRG